MTTDSPAGPDTTAPIPTPAPTSPTATAGEPSGYEDRVLGCLLGTMVGEAYGILSAAGDDPTAALDDPEAAMVSDATQLTLYTVDGLVDALEWANDGVAADETACLWLAYLRWLDRQGEYLPAGAPVILLDHQPRNARHAASRGVALQLSGHTHGGMIVGLDRVVARANNGFVSGRYDVDGMTLYLNNGTALWPGFALRLGVPSELTRITLRRQTASS